MKVLRIQRGNSLERRAKKKAQHGSLRCNDLRAKGGRVKIGKIVMGKGEIRNKKSLAFAVTCSGVRIRENSRTLWT